MVAGGFAYKWLFIAQHNDAEKVFKELLLTVKPSRILEIGTMHGGLTLMIKDILDNINLSNTIIRTYDINDQEFLKPLVVDTNVQVITKNLFNENYSDWNSNNEKEEIKNFINNNGTTMVLCDGGCKKCEFNLIAPLLKIDDIIMAHDYAPDNQYFEEYMKDKIWDWHEIQDSDILDISNSNNLITYKQELMQSIAWCCRRKINSLVNNN